MDEPDQTGDARDQTGDAASRERNNLISKLDRLEKANRETLDQLQRRGNPPNGLMLTRIRLELLITALLGGEDSTGRIRFELVWQKELQEYLASLYQKAEMNKLHIPGQR